MALTSALFSYKMLKTFLLFSTKIQKIAPFYFYLFQTFEFKRHLTLIFSDSDIVTGLVSLKVGKRKCE